MMKNGKKWLACLLAAVLALAAFTACSGGIGSMGAYTNKEQGEALAQKLNVQYDVSLQEDAYRIADWMTSSQALKQEAGHLVCKVSLDTSTNFGYQDELNYFLDASGCYGVPMDATIALELKPSESIVLPASIYVPQLDGADVALSSYAAGSERMGAALIDYNGTTYVVAVFQ